MINHTTKEVLLEKEKCETEGCEDKVEYRGPWGNRLCKDCIQTGVDNSEYSWDEC